MAYRKVPLVDGEFFHVYNRGNSKQKIFLDEADYQHFTQCLFLCNSIKKFKFRTDIVEKKIDAFDFEKGEPLVSIGAWVLMPNHFHIYLTVHQSDWCENKNKISEFMRKLLTAYTLYFNAKYDRTGGLFEGKFKSEHVKNENHSKYLFSYIHLNPIKLIDSNWKDEGIKDVPGAIKFLNQYKWSSYIDYREYKRKENIIVDRNHFLNYFTSVKDFNTEILEWVTHQSDW